MLLVATQSGVHRPDGAPEMSGRAVGALVAHGSETFAAVEGRGVWRRTAAGAWTEVTRLSDEVTCLGGDRAGKVLVGTTGAHLRLLDVAGGRVEPLDGFEEAPTREKWHTPWGGPPDTRSMATGGDGSLYVNVHVGGILRSEDGGLTWSPTIDLDADVHQVICPLPHRPDLVLAACAEGLARSDDRGETWTIDDRGLHSGYCRAVAVAGETVLITASDGPGGTHARVYRRPLEGASELEPCTAGLPEWLTGNIDTGWLDAHGDNAAFATADGRLFVSDDEGATWSQAASGLPPPAGVLLS